MSEFNAPRDQDLSFASVYDEVNTVLMEAGIHDALIRINLESPEALFVEFGTGPYHNVFNPDSGSGGSYKWTGEESLHDKMAKWARSRGIIMGDGCKEGTGDYATVENIVRNVLMNGLEARPYIRPAVFEASDRLNKKMEGGDSGTIAYPLDEFCDTIYSLMHYYLESYGYTGSDSSLGDFTVTYEYVDNPDVEATGLNYMLEGESVPAHYRSISSDQDHFWRRRSDDSLEVLDIMGEWVTPGGNRKGMTREYAESHTNDKLASGSHKYLDRRGDAFIPAPRKPTGKTRRTGGTMRPTKPRASDNARPASKVRTR